MASGCPAAGTVMGLAVKASAVLPVKVVEKNPVTSPAFVNVTLSPGVNVMPDADASLYVRSVVETLRSVSLFPASLTAMFAPPEITAAVVGVTADEYAPA